MPRGVYPRKKHKPTDQPAQRKQRRAGELDLGSLIAPLRAARTKAEDRVVAIGTAIDALEQ